MKVPDPFCCTTYSDNNTRDRIEKELVIKPVFQVGGWMNRGWDFFSSPLHPDQLQGPITLLPNRYQG